MMTLRESPWEDQGIGTVGKKGIRDNLIQGLLEDRGENESLYLVIGTGVGGGTGIL